MNRYRIFGCVLGLTAAMLLAGCQTTTGIRVIDPVGNTREITPEEMLEMGGGPDQPYLIQVGDQLDLRFKARELRRGESPWDYRIEVGDSMEVRFSPQTVEPGEYVIEAGDVLGISFLNNWPLNMNRTVRPDGKIGATEVGDVQAAGLTPTQLQKRLTDLYMKTGIIQGDPQISVNVDFVNLDRFESISREVTVRPNGGISLPMLPSEIHVAGLTVSEACEAIRVQTSKVFKNPPVVGLVIFPQVNTSLEDMSVLANVRPDGKISVPRLDEQIQAAGYDVDELRERLLEAATELVRNPLDVTVEVAEATGARIYVGGEVGVPGAYPLASCPTALQAVILARGASSAAKLNNVLVIRRNPDGKPYVFQTNLSAALKKGFTENDIPLQAFDIVYVPTKLIVRGNQFVERYIDNMVPFDNTLGVSGTYYLNKQRTSTKSRNVGANVVFSPLQQGVILAP